MKKKLSRREVPSKDLLNHIGSVFWLCQFTKQYSKYSFNLMLSEILIPIKLGQYKIYNVDDSPAGFVCWAKVSDKVLQEMKSFKRSLRYDEWDSGNNLYIAQFIAPFGNVYKISKNLVEIFSKENIKSAVAIKVSNTNTDGGLSYKLRRFERR